MVREGGQRYWGSGPVPRELAMSEPFISSERAPIHIASRQDAVEGAPGQYGRDRQHTPLGQDSS